MLFRQLIINSTVFIHKKVVAVKETWPCNIISIVVLFFSKKKVRFMLLYIMLAREINTLFQQEIRAIQRIENERNH